MKSKKKLIYKLHQNINENPFKQIDQVSYRNAGVFSYDFNKLKSIRAISLKGLESDHANVNKDSSDWKKKYDLKMNMLSMKDEIRQQAQQALICNKKKIVIDKAFVNMQAKKLNVRNLLNQKNLQANSGLKDEKAITNQDYAQQSNEYETDSNNSPNAISEEQSPYMPVSCLPRPKPAQGHSRNISLPIINNRQQQSQNSLNSLNSRRQLDLLVEEQKAKQQVLKQIRFNAQQKINKQVLMSIKLKSIQNLERIARSQSEVIKIDKWKEKYGQIGGMKNSEQLKLKDKASYTKGFLPQIQQKLGNNGQFVSPRFKSKPSNRYIDNTGEQVGQLQKSDIQLAKDSLNNVAEQKYFYNQDELLYTNNLINFQRQFSSIEQGQIQRKPSQLQQYYSTQIVSKEQQEKIDFWYSQPLKITITQLKKKDKKNKQNQNLSKPKEKQVLPKEKIQVRQHQNQGIQAGHQQNQQTQKNITIDISKQQKLNQQPKKQQSSPISKPFKTRSKLYLSLQNPSTNYQQQYMLTSPITFSTKRISNPKCRINEQNTILDKIVEDGMPMQWQNKRYADDEIGEFDMFVRNQAKEKDEHFNF